MITVSGKCLSCHPREATKKDGSKFTVHRCCIHNPSSGSDPVYVNTGETPLTLEKYYKMMIRVSTFVKKSGEAAYELMTYYNHPPQEVAAPQANPAK